MSPEAGSDGDDGPHGDSADRDPAAIVDEVDRPVLLIDGVCNLCNRGVRLVVAADDADRIRIAHLQSPVGAELLARHGLATDYVDSVVLVTAEGCLTRSDAVLELCRRLGTPYSLVSAVRFVPTPVRDRVYDLVATHRYRLFGRSEACQVPEPAVRERFLARSLGESAARDESD